MKDLSTKYLGLDLKNPLLVGSCGLTNSVDKIKELEDNNAAGIVLKSLFEEQIQAEISSNMDEYNTDYPGAFDYVRDYSRGNEVEKYLRLISDAKKTVDIPIIASINCVSGDEWISFAKSVEQAGADALELNISLLPSNPQMTSAVNEEKYFNILDSVGGMLSIPLALKMSHYSASLANLISKLSWNDNVAGFVLFNRYYMPDIDIEKMEVTSSNVLSRPDEIYESLRWVAIMSGLIKKDLAASTGVHDSTGVIKQLLAGATAVQVVSALYNNGPAHLKEMLVGLEKWMDENSYDSLNDFRGKLSYDPKGNSAVFERTQFMKYYSGMS